MESLPLETVGIGGIAISGFWLFWRIFQQQAKQNERTVEVIAKNVEANTKLANSIDRLNENVQSGSQNTVKNGEAIDRFTTIVLELIKAKDNH